jgi:hypothetical protein
MRFDFRFYIRRENGERFRYNECTEGVDYEYLIKYKRVDFYIDDQDITGPPNWSFKLKCGKDELIYFPHTKGKFVNDWVYNTVLNKVRKMKLDQI